MTNSRLGLLAACAGLLLATIPHVAYAHPGHVGDFHDGWQHPLAGLDHLSAMIAVGLLAVRIGGRGLWLVPGAFLSAMLAGGVVAAAGVSLPGAEAGILASVVVLGVLIASAGVAPLWFAMPVVAMFACFHGHAHVAAMAAQGSLASYAMGFFLTTTALHISGVLGGVALTRLRYAGAIRVAGGGIAAIGTLLAVGWI